MHTPALVAWQLADGKRGHERQSEGLLAALAQRCALATYRVPVRGTRGAYLGEALRGRFPAGDALPRPDLLIGAGRATQLALVAARRAHGGRSVYLMRPALPWHCFDVCIVPRHDAPPARPDVLVSEGPLNPVAPAATRQADLGLILLGGPSAHHAWDQAAIVSQVRRILAAAPGLDWHLADSRRSPPDLGRALAALAGPRVRYVAATAAPPDWLPAQLARAAQVWVSADSMAMLYEALSSGACVGLIDVPPRRHDRITAVAADLLRRGWVAPVGTPAPAMPPVVLAEAKRCAAALLERWPELVR